MKLKALFAVQRELRAMLKALREMSVAYALGQGATDAVRFEEQAEARAEWEKASKRFGDALGQAEPVCHEGVTQALRKVRDLTKDRANEIFDGNVVTSRWYMAALDDADSEISIEISNDILLS